MTSFLMFDLDEIFSKASQGYFEYPDKLQQALKSINKVKDSFFLKLITNVNANTHSIFNKLNLKETIQNQTWLSIIEVKSSLSLLRYERMHAPSFRIFQDPILYT